MLNAILDAKVYALFFFYFYGLEIIFSEANNGITKNTISNRVAHGLIVRCLLRFWQRKEAAPVNHWDTTRIPNSRLYFLGLWGLLGALKDLHMFLSCFTGSFQVVDSTTLDDIVGFHHRKEEISDIKFSPGKWQFINYFELKFQIKFTFWRQKWLHRSTNRFAVFFSLESDDYSPDNKTLVSKPLAPSLNNWLKSSRELCLLSWVNLLFLSRHPQYLRSSLNVSFLSLMMV